MNDIFKQDLEQILGSLTDQERRAFNDSTLLLTGCAGFLGFYFMNFFSHYQEMLGIRRIIGLDNFKMGCPGWLKDLDEQGKVDLHSFDITSDDLSTIDEAGRVTHILHMASIASPVYYRQYPLETLDANITGLRKLLDFYHKKPLKKIMFFSSSEIYGDPPEGFIPTPEDFRGYVDCQGPRACYDESKRLGETLCYIYHQRFGMPVAIVRPFNIYGPGMRLRDARVPADFARAIFENRDIVIYSDGSPTRTFCYISDAIVGYIKALLHHGFDTFNIGIDHPEISIAELAEIFQDQGRRVLGYQGEIRYETHEDREYLTNNPVRRCPSIEKARQLLGFAPVVSLEEGVGRFLKYVKLARKDEVEW
jgi:UDP-glucuronate decarboxylase